MSVVTPKADMNAPFLDGLPYINAERAAFLKVSMQIREGITDGDATRKGNFDDMKKSGAILLLLSLAVLQGCIGPIFPIKGYYHHPKREHYGSHPSVTNVEVCKMATNQITKWQYGEVPSAWVEEPNEWAEEAKDRNLTLYDCRNIIGDYVRYWGKVEVDRDIWKIAPRRPSVSLPIPKPGVEPDTTDTRVCDMAIRHSDGEWEKDPDFNIWVDEARNRELKPEDCVKLLKDN